jgi:hypothetical protein
VRARVNKNKNKSKTFCAKGLGAAVVLAGTTGVPPSVPPVVPPVLPPTRQDENKTKARQGKQEKIRQDKDKVIQYMKRVRRVRFRVVVRASACPFPSLRILFLRILLQGRRAIPRKVHDTI